MIFEQGCFQGRKRKSVLWEKNIIRMWKLVSGLGRISLCLVKESSFLESGRTRIQHFLG